MIFHYRWTTVKKLRGARLRFAGQQPRYRRTFWQGWFLFGFIPLYVTAIDADYE